MIDPDELMATLRLQRLQDWLNDDAFHQHVRENVSEYVALLKPWRDTLRNAIRTNRSIFSEEARSMPELVKVLERFAPLPPSYTWVAHIFVESPPHGLKVPGCDSCSFTLQATHMRDWIRDRIELERAKALGYCPPEPVPRGYASSWWSEKVTVRIVYRDESTAVDWNSMSGAAVLEALYVSNRLVWPDTETWWDQTKQ